MGGRGAGREAAACAVRIAQRTQQPLWLHGTRSSPAGPPGDPMVAPLQALQEGGEAGARLAPLARALHSLQVDALHLPRPKVLDGEEGWVAHPGRCT